MVRVMANTLLVLASPRPSVKKPVRGFPIRWPVAAFGHSAEPHPRPAGPRHADHPAEAGL